MNLLDAYGTKATKPYNGYSNIHVGLKFQNSGQSFKLEDIKNELVGINQDLNDILYDSSPANLGLNDALKLLSTSKAATETTIEGLKTLNAYGKSFSTEVIALLASDGTVTNRVSSLDSSVRRYKDSQVYLRTLLHLNLLMNKRNMQLILSYLILILLYYTLLKLSLQQGDQM